jgi:N-hydroxyarylamine O-acetyltransferase
MHPRPIAETVRAPRRLLFIARSISLRYHGSVNLDAYLARLGMKRPLEPTAETLRRLHVAHLAAFPFHNLTIQRRGVVSLDVDAIAERFLGGCGGGYCFEQNTLFGAALRELGFAVTTLLGRAGPPDKRALNHMLLRVDIDGQPWLADVGFGGEGPLEPIPLADGARVAQDGIEFSLRRDAHHWTLAMHYGDVTEEMYEFSGAPHTRGDVEMANFYTATHPASIFRRTLTIQRITPQERIILRPKVVTRYRNGARVDQPIEPSQLRALARELFAIDLGDSSLLFEESDSGSPSSSSHGAD